MILADPRLPGQKKDEKLYEMGKSLELFEKMLRKKKSASIL